MNLTELTITEAAEMIERREVSPVELTEAHLARIERVDPQLNCFITLTTQGALDEAHRAEATIGQGGYLGSLHGIPLAVKDIYETAGVPTTAGSTFLADFIAEGDCVAVLKLKASAYRHR